MEYAFTNSPEAMFVWFLSYDAQTKPEEISKFCLKSVGIIPSKRTNDTAPKRQSPGCPRGATDRKHLRTRCMAVTHSNASVAQIRAEISTTVTQRTVKNWLLQGQIQVRHTVACVPLTPSHFHLRRQWCQSQSSLKNEVEIC
ncbi:transposable element Tc1 transposase [Trichonephila clavipes]|nr:transposable element Tc1 transposase [Trichonephila clavipes]